MEAADYKTLLTQAEEELGKTPGAYCSRKVAVRAMELLQVAGQRQYEEDVVGVVNQVKLRDKIIAEQKATIERQAEAIKRLESEKTQWVGSKNAGELARTIDDEIRKGRDQYGIFQLERMEQKNIRKMEAERYESNFHKDHLNELGPPFQDFPNFK